MLILFSWQGYVECPRISLRHVYESKLSYPAPRDRTTIFTRFRSQILFQLNITQSRKRSHLAMTSFSWQAYLTIDGTKSYQI